MVKHGIEEHRISEFIMSRIKKNGSDDKTLDARFKAIMESTKHHFELEETDLFPKAKKALEGDLRRLGEQMDALKEKKGK